MPVREVIIRLGGRVIAQAEPQGGTPVTGGRLRKYVFNIWHDLGDWPPGLYRLQIHLPGDLLASPRFRLIDGRLSFDAFDALLSHASVFVGNDSGPKHLASLRGTPVVSLHSARINWSEWGQDNTGLIVSRNVPCAGCAIFHDVEECGRDFVCVTAIRPEEVMDAVSKVLTSP